MENFFPDSMVRKNPAGIPVRESTLWSHFEEALGKFDAEGIFQYFTEDIEIDYDHPTQSTAAIEDTSEQHFGRLLDEMQSNFEEWIADIDATDLGKTLRKC